MEFKKYLERKIVDFAIGFAIIGLGIMIVFFIWIAATFSIGANNPTDMAITGQVGDYIGGIVGTLWSFASILLFYSSLKSQKEEWKQGRDEDLYFKMLEHHYKIEFLNKENSRDLDILHFTNLLKSRTENLSDSNKIKSTLSSIFTNNGPDGNVMIRIAESLYFILRFLYKSDQKEPDFLLNHLSNLLSNQEKSLLYYYLRSCPYKLTDLGEKYYSSSMIPYGDIPTSVLESDNRVESSKLNFRD